MEARRTRIKTSLIPIVGTGTSSSQSPGSAYFFTRAFKGVSCPHGSDGCHHEGRKEELFAVGHLRYRAEDSGNGERRTKTDRTCKDGMHRRGCVQARLHHVTFVVAALLAAEPGLVERAF